MPELDVQFRALKAKDDRTEFCCGNIELDRFFQRYAGQNQFRHHVGISYVLTVETKVVGFVTVSAGDITVEELPINLRQRLPEYPLPITHYANCTISHR